MNIYGILFLYHGEINIRMSYIVVVMKFNIMKGRYEDNEYIVALKWANESVDNNFKKCSSILKKLIELKSRYNIEEPHFTNRQDINILAYAYGDENEIDNLVKDIEAIDGVEKAEAKPLIPV